MKKMLLIAVMLTPVLASAQTKKIAHRSHSGAAAAFSPGAGNDDFGLRSGYRAEADSARARQERQRIQQEHDSLTRAQQQRNAPKPRTRPKRKH